MKKFTSYEEYEAWTETVENPERYHSYIDDGWKLMLDMETNCKSYKTAIRRFRKVYAELANVLTEDEFTQVEGWMDTMEESYESGYFEDRIRMASSVTKEDFARDEEYFKMYGAYSWGVEEVSEGCWYLYLNLSGEWLKRAPRKTAEEITETAETVETTEATTTTETTETTETTATTVTAKSTATTTTESKPTATTAPDTPADTTATTAAHTLNLPGCTNARMSLGFELAKPPDHSQKIGDFPEYVKIYDGPVMDIELKSEMTTVYRVGENDYFLHMHD